MSQMDKLHENNIPEIIKGIDIFDDLEELGPFEMMTGKGWLEEANFYKSEDVWKVWKVRLLSM